MEIDHRHQIEQALWDDPAVGHHDRQIGSGHRDIIDGVGYGNAQTDGRLLHRAGGDGPSPAPAPIRARDAERDVVPGGHQGTQRADGHFGGAEKREPSHSLTVEQETRRTRGRPGPPADPTSR